MEERAKNHHTWFDPKYNSVAINGMNAPSTSSTDRSTDLNMISPDMIAGAEVLKASTADKDADGLGGTVNLIMKDAPRDFKLNVTEKQVTIHKLMEWGGIKVVSWRAIDFLAKD